MGRRNKNISISLEQQAYNKLHNMLLAGEGTSKTEAKRDGSIKNKIFSFSTFRTYLKQSKYFTSWIRENHADCTTIKAAKKYVNDYLAERCNTINAIGRPLSAWTIQLEAAAINKLYGIDKSDVDRFQAPIRHRQDIVRSREETKQDKHFSNANNADLISFCRSTGCRRNILEKLQGKDYWTRSRMEETYANLDTKSNLSKDENKLFNAIKDALTVFRVESDFIYHRRDKGGKDRFAPIIGDDAAAIIARMKSTPPTQKVWGKVPKNADIHSYRADYATTLYRQYARDVKCIPYDKINRGSGRPYQSEAYICRGDYKGKKLDKSAMYKVSKALGHNRLDVVANNYIRN